MPSCSDLIMWLFFLLAHHQTKQDFFLWSQIQNHSQVRCPRPSQSKENDAGFYWNQPRVVFIIENIQYFWTSHKKPSRYICSSSKCWIDNRCATCSTILIMQTSSSLLFLQCFPFIFFKPRKHILLSFPTPILTAEKNQRLSKGYIHCIESMELRGIRIIFTAI